ncbi:MAG TPA: hypothetical protein VE263_10565 [Candidatus Angelobacter sp.]|nr:hypothetical protein [Candidatus Angelobacter sp.]
MLDSAFDLREVQTLHQMLVITVQQVKTLHATVGAMMADIAAIRRTVLQDPEEVLDYKNNLLSTIETARPLVDEALQSYDEMIRQIGESEGFSN